MTVTMKDWLTDVTLLNAGSISLEHLSRFLHLERRYSSQRSAMKKIVIKVAINCQICKTDVLKAVAKLTGIDQVSVDGEKGILTVVGDVDPVLVVKRLKKIKKCPEIVSIGPPKPPEPEKPKPKPPPTPVPCLPPSCKDCQLVAVGYYLPYEGRMCSIL
ncbi:hypothetical protein Pint_21878 [Pistacia integerrima]|uniref:Uncharacterized protein n=1 Tax=Pistacia integerrima TaxID=434235 RepID=A0ACC0X9Q6_9ROSI|nr:hypothetical protein Pint_21878 [Pistacia integerrima]